MICAVIQARLNSSRFPEKVLERLGGMTVLEQVIQRTMQSHVDWTVLATPDEYLAAVASRVTGCHAYWAKGVPENNVHERFRRAVSGMPDAIVRVNADCPFIDPERINELITLYESSPGVRYCGYRRASDGVPAVLTNQGLPELVDFKAFYEHMQRVQEHVTWGMYEDPRTTAWIEHPCDEHNTIDTPEDLERLRKRMEIGEREANRT
jgi:spore coat polysaccharide biosynthesis protein SpsF